MSLRLVLLEAGEAGSVILFVRCLAAGEHRSLANRVLRTSLRYAD
ncbi:hypothetical protein QMK38_08855 [Lysinibacillus fusiformis]|nr:hypothetical protein [Lysinibacillus fusiformis]